MKEKVKEGSRKKKKRQTERERRKKRIFKWWNGNKALKWSKDKKRNV